MNYKELAKAKWKEYAELVAKQKALLDANKDGLDEAKAKEFDELQTKLDALAKETERYEKMAENEEKSNATVTNPLPLPVPGNNDKQADVLDDGGFASLGDFVKAVRFGDSKGRLNKADMVGTDDNGNNEGGFLVPPKYSEQILSLEIEGAFVRNYATVLGADPSTPDARVTIPAMDYSVNNYGGVAVDWVEDEGGEKPQTDMAMTMVNLVPHEIAGWIAVSDKLLRNSRAAEPIITRNLREALLFAEQDAFLHGDGEGKPAGVLSDDNKALVSIALTKAGTVGYKDLITMRTRMTQPSYQKAVWVVDQSQMLNILSLKDDAGNLIYLPGTITTGGVDMLLGRPIVWSNANTGIALIDFSAYLVQDGAGIYLGASEHVRYTKNQTVIKIFRYVDGAPWVVNLLKFPNKLELSPYVLLKGTIIEDGKKAAE